MKFEVVVGNIVKQPDMEAVVNAIRAEIKGEVVVVEREPLVQGGGSPYLDRLLAVDLKGDRLDLAPYAGTLPGSAIVTGSREAIALLKLTLEKPHDT